MSEKAYFKLMAVNGGQALVKLENDGSGRFVPKKAGTKRFLAKDPGPDGYQCVSTCSQGILWLGLSDTLESAKRKVRERGIEIDHIST